MTGLWVIAHECGHRAFASQDWINYLVGHILHTLLLVPFHPWRISHANHHSNTNCIEHDEVFVPATYDAREQLAAQNKKHDSSSDTSSAWHRTTHKVEEAFATSPLGALFSVSRVAIVGWPAYLAINASGPEKYVGARNSHFEERSELFTKGERSFVRESMYWFAAVATGLALLTMTVGADTMAAHYIVPYLVVNAHLTLITYLQHTDSYVPHWHEAEFTFLRGALATVDRSWGVVRDILFHHIADSHVVHHLFSDMPFYNALKATEILEGWEDFQKYRLKDDTPIWRALLRSGERCRVVPSGGSVCWYEDGRVTCLDPAVVLAGGSGGIGKGKEVSVELDLGEQAGEQKEQDEDMAGQ